MHHSKIYMRRCTYEGRRSSVITKFFARFITMGEFPGDFLKAKNLRWVGGARALRQISSPGLLTRSMLRSIPYSCRFWHPQNKRDIRERRVSQALRHTIIGSFLVRLDFLKTRLFDEVDQFGLKTQFYFQINIFHEATKFLDEQPVSSGPK